MAFCYFYNLIFSITAQRSWTFKPNVVKQKSEEYIVAGDLTVLSVVSLANDMPRNLVYSVCDRLMWLHFKVTGISSCKS